MRNFYENVKKIAREIIVLFCSNNEFQRDFEKFSKKFRSYEKF